MALTKIGTDGIKDDAVTSDKVANAINSSIAANTAKDLTALSASNLTSGTIPDARFPTTLPAASAANLTAVPAANITGTLPAISGANLTNLPASGRTHNLVINGAMNVSQRNGTDATTAQNTYTLDRFGVYLSAMDQLVQSIQQVTDAPDEFGHSLKITTTTPETSIESNEYMHLSHKIEGQDLQHLAYGTSNAKSIVLSFYVKSSITGTYGVNIFRDESTDRSITRTYTINSANTWERKTLTVIAGDTAHAITNTNTRRFEISWHLAAGSDWTSGGALNTWSGWTNATFASGHAQNGVCTTNGATWQITGVQLEVGDTVSDFAHESYADTLAKCQRYLCVALPKGSRATLTECAGMYADQQIQASVNFPVTMRTTPSLVYSNVSNYFIAYSANNNALFSSMNFESDVSSNSTGAIYANVGSTSGDWTGNSAMLRDQHNNAYVYFEAEL